MSDTEDVQAKRRMSDSSSASSADEDSSMAKKPQELDNSGFRVDGEPMNKPRKVRLTPLILIHISRSDKCKVNLRPNMIWPKYQFGSDYLFWLSPPAALKIKPDTRGGF